MKKKIAIPITEEGNLNSHFGHSAVFAVIETEDKTIISNQKLTPPPHTPGAIPKWLIAEGVTDVIAGGIGEKASKILEHFGVNVHKGAASLSSDELIVAFLNGSIELNDKNCSHNHHEHHHEHHAEGHHHHSGDHHFDGLKIHRHQNKPDNQG